MSSRSHLIPRRRFLGGLALGATLFHVRGAFADELSLTPRQTEGPFYPDKLPLDTDNDLILVNDDDHPGRGRGDAPDGPHPGTERRRPCATP